MSYYKRQSAPQSTPRRRPATKAATWSNKPLSNEQKAKISITARTAWDAQSQAGLVDGKFDDWRHAETMVACGIASLRDASQTQYLSILAHFLRLAGKTAEAEALWKRTGRVSGSDETYDTHENREIARAVIRDLMASSGGRIHDGYIGAILRDRFEGRDLYHLSAGELQQLVFTLRTRLRKIRQGHE